MRGWRRWWRWGLLAGVILAIAVLATAWLMFQHVPEWYRPLAIAPVEQQRVRDDLVGTLDRLGAALINAPGPFEFRFTQGQVNAWLAVREGVWPGVRDWIPPEVSDPFITFAPDGVRLAVTYSHGSLRTVVSAHLTASAEADVVHARLLEVAAGDLGVPAGWVRGQLAALAAGRWRAGKRSSLQIAGPPLPAFEQLVEGADFPNRWIWKNGDQPFRIAGLRLEPGALVVTFEPLRRQRTSR